MYRGALRWLIAFARLTAIPVAWMEKHALAVMLSVSGAMVLVAGNLGRTTAVHGAFAVAPTPELLIGACCIAAVSLVCASSETSDDRWLPLEIGLLACFAIAGMMALSEGRRFGLLETASLLSIWPVWRSARSLQSKLVYLGAMTVSGVCLALAQAVSAPADAGWSRAFLLTSVCLKFAAIPFCFWILRLADELPPTLLGFILAVVDMAAVSELLQLSQADPSLFAPQTVWLVAAVLTSVAAALLMIAQRDMKRLLVLSSIEDLGFLILGVSSLSSMGQSAVVLAAASHAMAKSLLFISIASPQQDGASCHAASGLAARYPFSAFGFFVGMLGMLGVPPLLGYAGRWRLYEVALQSHPALLAGFVLA